MRPLLHILKHVIDPRRPDDDTIMFGNDSGIWAQAAITALRSGCEVDRAIVAADLLLVAYRYRAGSGLTVEQIRKARCVEKDYP